MARSPRVVPEPEPGRTPVPGGEGAPAAEDARAAYRLLAGIVECSDDAILSRDLDGIITSWNAGAERIYGYTAAEAVGRPVTLILPPELPDEGQELMARLRRGERVQHFETVRVARDGRRLHVSLTLSPLRDDAGRVVGASAIGRDITDRKREASRWRLLSEVGQALAGTLDPEEQLRALARLLLPELADYCVTYLADGDRIRRVGAAHRDPRAERLVRRLFDLTAPSLDDPAGAGKAIRTGEPILSREIVPEVVDRMTVGEEHRRLVRELGPISSIVLPLRARGRTLGAIALATTALSRRRYDEADLVLGREIAERAALELDNARLYLELRSELKRRQAAEESLRRRFRQLRVLYEMTEAVERARAVEEVYERALHGLRHALEVERASILLFDPDGATRFRAWRGLSEEYRRAVEEHAPWALDARDPAPVVIADVETDTTFPDALRPVALREGIRALAFIPLVSGGQLLGKFMLYSSAPRTLTADELELARTIAGTIAFAITRMRDVRSVQEAKEAAERANEAKSQFLGVMSHELRTPLNAVMGYSELLLMETRGAINPEQRTQLERIQASARHQLGLVEELLAYARLEAGREEPRLMRTDVRRVANDVAELVRPEAEAKGLRLVLDVPDTPLAALTDPARLRQIVLNLAANATKYTQRGTVAIGARRAGERLVIEVADTGPGIPEERQAYVFEPFARLDAALTRSSSGTGLGLAIARRLADLLGAELRLSSRAGEGSTFSLSLPPRDAAEPAG